MILSATIVVALTFITVQEGADLKTWIELVALIALAGAFINEVRVMGRMIREQGVRIKAFEKSVAMLARVEVRMKYMNYEIRRLSNALSCAVKDCPNHSHHPGDYPHNAAESGD